MGRAQLAARTLPGRAPGSRRTRPTRPPRSGLNPPKPFAGQARRRNPAPCQEQL